MYKTTTIFFLLVATSFIAQAHLCNDVFDQARDNLAVKVDIRDGQLRIGDESSFRVYVLNTMDRNIAEIALDVESDEFDAIVQPSPGWSSYPALHTTRRTAANKEYFSVSLRRKPGVPDGSYKIGLNLVSRRQKRSFRTLNLESAADICPMPKLKNLVIDGKATRAKWGEAYLCSDFQIYRQVGKYMENVSAPDQTRVRVAYDNQYIYFLASFHGADNADEDTLLIHVAPTADVAPVKLSINRESGKITGDSEVVKGATAVANSQYNVLEVRVPRTNLGIAETDRFYMNFSRKIIQGDISKITYWRGNELSLAQPIVYGQFVFSK